jgi:hypothetical protein
MGRRSTVVAVVSDLSRWEEDATSGCWNWTGAKVRSGHPVVKIGGRTLMAYRVFYAYFVAPLRDGIQVHHTCENPACVNPAHLLAVTAGEHARIHAKLDFAKATEIRRQYFELGKTQSEIASIFGVDQTTVSCVTRGRTWRPEVRTAPVARAA